MADVMECSENIYDSLPKERADIAAMSRAARQAVVAPAAPGGWSVAWRHAVAARVCAGHGQHELARSYLAEAGVALQGLAEPGFAGRDAREIAVLAFVDRVATEPRRVEVAEIETLKTAGIAEADIVRLCELAAYLAYECRVAAGLSLLKGGL